MFRKIIRQSPFISPGADNVFPNITGESWNGDVSFVSTLRALVTPRANGEKLRLVFNTLSLRESDIPRSNPSVLMSRLGSPTNACIRVINITSRELGSAKQWMDFCAEKFESVYQNYTRISKVTEFFKRTFYVLCFVNHETKDVFLLVEDMNIKTLHYLQCAVFAFLPWYFNPEDGASESELELIESLRERGPEKYENCLEKMAKKYDFRAAEIKRLLKDFETRSLRIRLVDIERDAQQILANLQRLKSQMVDHLRRKNELEISRLGIESKIAKNDGKSEIMDYFLKRRELYLEDVTDSTMDFSAKGYLVFFDEAIAKRIVEDSTSYLYENDSSCRQYIPEGGMQKLLRAIFVDQTLRVKVCAAYRFYLGEDVTGLSSHAFGSDFNDCMPNPHINIYSCMGDYEPMINSALRDNDYLLALEQAIASCQSLNFGDTTVMRAFMRILYGVDERGFNNRCIELPDGRVVTPQEAINWLSQEEAEISTKEAANE